MDRTTSAAWWQVIGTKLTAAANGCVIVRSTTGAPDVVLGSAV